MKKPLITLLLLIFCVALSQNNIEEPQYIGDIYIIDENGNKLELSKERAQIRAKARAFLGMKIHYELKGCCSNTSYSGNPPLNLVVKAVDNKKDPTSIIEIFEFDKRKKKRRAELIKTGLTGGTSNNLNYLSFTSEPIGESSYLLKVSGFDKGSEYGIIVRNSNALDETIDIISTFSID